MKHKARIANKTQWALDDIVKRCKEATFRWEEAMELAGENPSPGIASLLGRLRDDIAVIERLAKDAINGDYTDNGGNS